MENLTAFWQWSIYRPAGSDPITVGDAVLVLTALLAGYLLSRFIEYVLARRLANTELRGDAIYTIKRASFYVILCLVFFTVLSLLGIPLTVFAFATGALAVGIGFGAQNIINNFISGWILMAEQPIRMGDFIEIEGGMGTVEKVGTRSTQIRRLDGVDMLVPNSKLLENTVTNWTLNDNFVRSSVKVGVAYGSDVVDVADILKVIVSTNPHTLDHPPIEIIFDDFGDSALIFDCQFWVDTACGRPLRLIRSDIRFAISHAFRKNNIEIAFPQLDLHLRSPDTIRLSNASVTQSDD